MVLGFINIGNCNILIPFNVMSLVNLSLTFNWIIVLLILIFLGSSLNILQFSVITLRSVSPSPPLKGIGVRGIKFKLIKMKF